MHAHESTSTLSTLSPVEVKLEVQVPWGHVQHHLDESFVRLQRTARIKGFRPGKAPARIVEQVYGASVRSDVLSTLIEEGVSRALHEHAIEPLGDPRLEAESLRAAMKQGEPLSFAVIVEVRPAIDSLVLDGMRLTRRSTQIPDANIDAELQKLRELHSETRVPDPARPAKDGDKLTIDYSVTVDGTPRDDLKASGVSMTLDGDEGLLPGLVEGLRGRTTGETATISLTFPDDFGAENLRGKPAVFDVTVHDIQEVVLPELDDDFAKDCGDFPNLDALKASIRARLESRAREESDSEARAQLVEQLTEKNPVPVPPSMVQRQFLYLQEEMKNFLRMLGKDGADLMPPEDNLRKQAEQKVRASILFAEISRRENFQVTDEELESEIRKMAERSGKHVAKLRAELGAERAQWLRLNLIEAKVTAFLKSKAIIEEASETGASAARETGTADTQTELDPGEPNDASGKGSTSPKKKRAPRATTAAEKK